MTKFKDIEIIDLDIEALQPEPRDKVEAEFAARRQVVVAMLNQWIVRVRA